MRLPSTLCRSANNAIRTVGTILRLPYLPSRFHGHWVRLPCRLWLGFRYDYEPAVARVLEQCLRPGGCFVDVGAHQGFWSLYAAKLMGDGAYVCSIEPSPAVARLELVARLYPAIRIVRCALGAAPGEATFYAQGESASGSLVESVTDITRSLQPEVPVQPQRVAIRTLDGIVSGLERAPSLVKIDTEGFELQVLRGGAQTLAQRVPLVIEIHPPQLKLSGGSEGELSGLLKQNGYQVDVIDRNPNSLYTIFAR